DSYDGWAIGLATSRDGESWEKWQGNPVLRPGPPGGWDSRSVHDPRVLWDGRRFLMWYSGYDGVRWRVGLATSEDGLRWARFPGNPVLETGPVGSWDESGVAYSSVLAQAGSYLMWYQGLDPAGRWRIGHAASLDGVQWFKSAENPVLGPGPPGAWDQERAFTPHVLSWRGGFLMLYGGGLGGRELGYAFSADGVRWRKALAGPALPVQQAGLAAPPDTRYLTVAALREGTWLHVWYGQQRGEGATSVALRRRVAAATSGDWEIRRASAALRQPP
ncbi:MAG: hypothetical protein HYY02_06215, partial [Chloroflexi bacterium]|nr:hypothetical protein [Chloroflexota bacterium]